MKKILKLCVIPLLFFLLSINLFAEIFDLSSLREDKQNKMYRVDLSSLREDKQNDKQNNIKKPKFDLSFLQEKNQGNIKTPKIDFSNFNIKEEIEKEKRQQITEKLKNFFDPEENVIVRILIFLLIITFIFIYPIQILIIVIGLFFHLFKEKQTIKNLFIPYGFVYILKNRYSNIENLKQDLKCIKKYTQTHITNILLIIIIILLIVCFIKILDIENNIFSIDGDISDIKDRIQDLEIKSCR